jgi:hypothetical protein
VPEDAERRLRELTQMTRRVVRGGVVDDDYFEVDVLLPERAAERRPKLTSGALAIRLGRG